MWPFSTKFTADGLPLDEQLKLLAQCGIAPRPTITLEWLKQELNAWKPHPTGIKHLLLTMGNDEFSDNIWHFDTECIEDYGDYANIAVRMMQLAGGALPLQKIEDHVEVEEGEAWLSFSLDGKSYKWDLKVNDDWVDEVALTKFVGLLDGRQNERHFTYCDLQGQDCLIGCCSAAQLKELNRITNMQFEWLR